MLETRIPPPIVVALLAATMWGARRLAPDLTAHYSARLPLSLAVLALGVGVIAAGVLEFRRARTTVDPLHPDKATAVVDTGIYRFTRNPMYLGMLLALAAWATWLANPVTLAGPILFVFYIDRFQIRPEERALLRVFGAPYQSYLGRVRRWI